MLELVDLNERITDKSEYKRKYDSLIKKLIVLQQQAVRESVGLVVLFEGFEGAGKGSRISDLMYNLDARATHVHVTKDIDIKDISQFDKVGKQLVCMHPFMQEFWEALGERSQITFFDRGWYTKLVEVNQSFLSAKNKASSFKAGEAFNSIKNFERQLVNDGYTVVKFFVSVTRDVEKKRLKALKENPATAWRVNDKKRHAVEHFDENIKIFDSLISNSNFEFAPWTLINGCDKRVANLTIASVLIDALDNALKRKSSNASVGTRITTKEMSHIEIADIQHSFAPLASRYNIVPDYPKIEEQCHTLTLDKETYTAERKRLQSELFELENRMYRARIPLLIMYEGWDAAGKGGNIKRVAQALDARSYDIIPSPAPTKPELAHPHLWRYWTRLPRAGHVGLFDRSWYGRVLVERVEEITPPSAWARGYDEINEFERDLIDWGAILIKFWVDVSKEEQLNRFNARKTDPNKYWKITDEDWRNREKYEEYRSAIDDMFRLTSTDFAPWTILESDNKYYARIKALNTIVDALNECIK